MINSLNLDDKMAFPQENIPNQNGFFQKKLIESIPYFENFLTNPNSFNDSTINSISIKENWRRNSSFEDQFFKKLNFEGVKSVHELESIKEKEKEKDLIKKLYKLFKKHFFYNKNRNSIEKNEIEKGNKN